jgi:hypothetical protein
VDVKDPNVKVEPVAEVIFVHVEPFDDDCHCIVPVFPVNVKFAGVDPEQIV